MIVFPQLGNLGRLGNQLFQIAATLAHASRVETKAQFPKWEYNKYFLNPIDDKLNMEFDCIFEGKEYEMYFHPAPSAFKKIPMSDYLMLHGFFQSEKYFADHIEKIAWHLKPKNEILKVVHEAGKEFLHLHNLVAIHVRRGDYLLPNAGQMLLSMDYYSQAFVEIENHLKIKSNFPHIVTPIIFSDDIAWCKKHFGDTYFYSEGNSEIIDLLLMAQCKHHIIANSSFSWWGSWLAKNVFGNNEGITIAPERWDNAILNIDRKDIYCKDWIVLPEN